MRVRRRRKREGHTDSVFKHKLLAGVLGSSAAFKSQTFIVLIITIKRIPNNISC